MKALLISVIYILSTLAFLIITVVVCMAVTLFPRRSF
jgi:hypothetical protein